MKFKSKFNIAKWEESTIEQLTLDSKVSNAVVEYDLEGDFTGKAKVNYQMFYDHVDSENHLKSNAQYIGLLVVEGEFQNKKGTFVLRDEGTFENGIARSSLKVIPGSGTDDFTKIVGKGGYEASHTDSTFELDFTL